MLLQHAGGAVECGCPGRQRRTFPLPAAVLAAALLLPAAPAAAQVRLGGPAVAGDGPVSLVDEAETEVRRSRGGEAASGTGDAGAPIASGGGDDALAAVRAREHRPLGAGRDPVPLEAIGGSGSSVADADRVAGAETLGAASGEAPLGRDGADDGGLLPAGVGGAGDLVRTLAALAIVIAVAFVVRAGVRRVAGPLAGGGRPSGVLEVLARYPVGRSQFLVLLKVGRRVLVVHQAGSSMRTLSEIVEPTEVAALLGRMEAGARDADAGRFRARLGEFERDLQTERRTAAEPARPGPGAAARDDLPGPVRDRTESIEVIDLTRRRRRGALR